MNKNDKINAIIHNVPEKEEPYKKITEKQWTVYYYLLSISNYNSKDREDHRFVYKRDINITAISKTLGISRSTFYTATDALEKKNLITKYDNYYTMKVPYSYTQISRNLLQQLLSYRKVLTIDLLRTYLFFTLMSIDVKKGFTKRNIIRCLGHPDNMPEYYQRIEICIDLLRQWKLIQYKTEVKIGELGKITLYYSEKTFTESQELNQRFSNMESYQINGVGLSEQEENRIKKML